MLIPLGPPQWGKATPTGHFCGPAVKGDFGHEGLLGLSVFWLHQSEERLGWEGGGRVL